jgi:hypothetical protein
MNLKLTEILYEYIQRDLYKIFQEHCLLGCNAVETGRNSHRHIPRRYPAKCKE